MARKITIRSRRFIKPRSNEIEANSPRLTFIPNPGAQADFFAEVPLDKPYSNSFRYYLLRGGVGSGKSTCGAAFVAAQTQYQPSGIRGLITANSYGQLETSTLVAFAEYCFKYGYELEPCGESVELTARKIAHNRYCVLNSAYIFVLSAEAFEGRTISAKEVGRGLAIGWLWGDELLYAHESAFNTIDTRLGRTQAGNPIGVITSTINKNNPFNWGWKLFDSPDRSGEQKALYKSINLPTIENLHANSSYLSSLKASLSPELYQIEVLGQYVNISVGKVYPYFQREKHVRALEILDSPLLISLDFNWNPACGLIAQFDKNNLYVHRELYLKNANTFILAEEICKLIYNSSLPIYLYGDATGNARSANSNLTNWEIIWNAFKKYNIAAQRKYRSINPSVLDSANEANSLFYHGRAFVNPQCRELIADFEFLSWKKGEVGAIDKSDIQRSHLSDCFRYLASGIIPEANTNIKKLIWKM